MNKRYVSVLVLLCCVCSMSYARVNWLLLGETAHAGIYIDTASIERPRGYVKAWTLLSYPRRQAAGWYSERRLFLFSCKSQTLQWLQSIYYAEPMGEGEFVGAGTLNRYSAADAALIAPAARNKDDSANQAAVPESAFLPVFKELC